jgi:ABC-type transport system involved in cytochrome c biogenesis permease component
MDYVRRWLWASESTADSVIGGVLYGVLIVVVFRFAFGDSWAFAIGSGIVLAIASFAFSEWSRRRARTG